jgi:hypothetical protein
MHCIFTLQQIITLAFVFVDLTKLYRGKVAESLGLIINKIQFKLFVDVLKIF